MKEFINENTAGIILLLIMLIMSTVLYITMGRDKRLAQQGGFRIPEARLLWLAVLGGGIGGWAGMLHFRHKTRHIKFVLFFPLLSLLQLALLIFLFIKHI